MYYDSVHKPPLPSPRHNDDKIIHKNPSEGCLPSTDGWEKFPNKRVAEGMGGIPFHK